MYDRAVLQLHKPAVDPSSGLPPTIAYFTISQMGTITTFLIVAP